MNRRRIYHMFKSKVVILFLTIIVMIPSIGIAEVKANDDSPPADVNEAPPAAGQIPDSYIPEAYVPYFGQSIEQPEHIKELYLDPGVGFDTPGFQDGKWNFTTTEEMMEFLNELDRKSDFMQMETAGYSLEGREIPLLIFTTSDSEDSDDFKNKPTVWLEAQVHGNEAGSGEAALVIAQELATDKLGEEVLDDINVIILPRLNPDGSHYYQVGSARGLWINRDHMKLDLPETIAVNKAFNRFKPEVAMTSHEYGHRNWDTFSHFGEEGGAPYHDILLARGYNLNIPESVREMADDLFINNAFEDLEQIGYSTDTYFSFNQDNSKVTGKFTISEAGSAPRFETNIEGLSPSLSFLIESRGDRIGRESFERRVHSQVATIKSFLRTTVENATEVKSTVDTARDEIVSKGETIDENDKVIITSEAKTLPGERPYEVLDIATGEVVEVPTTYISNAEAVPTLERVRPTAYYLPPAYHHVAEKLKVHGVEVGKLNESMELTVDSYMVTDQKVADRVVEGHVTNHVETEIEEKRIFFPKGSYVFQMNQTSANIIALALEPESEDSYVTFNIIPVNVGDEVPVYRYMSEEKLDVEMVGDEVEEIVEEEGEAMPNTATSYPYWS
jgi:hypothetical protein